MTRDTKLALVVGFALVLAVGVLISDHFASGNRGEPEDLAGAAAHTPMLPLASAGDSTSDRAPAHDRGDPRNTGRGDSERADRADARPGGERNGEPVGAPIGPTVPSSQPESAGEVAQGEPVTFWQGRTPPPGSLQSGNPMGILPHERDASAGNPEGGPGAGANTPTETRIQTIPLAQLEQTLARNAGRMPTQEKQPESGDRWHIVREGESLWKIADRYYAKGAAWSDIAKANPDRVSDEGVVRVGVRIRLPEPRAIGLSDWAGGAPAPTPARGTPTPAKEISKPAPPKGAQSPREAKGGGVRTITVKKGETLGQIAQRELGRASRMEEIVRLNADQIDDADEIRAGMVLRLPK